MNTFKDAKRIVIKVGTSTLTHATGQLNIRRVEALVKVLSDLSNSGKELVLVTSGAISLGCGKAGHTQKPKDTPTKQAMAAIGQCELMYFYDRVFSRYNKTIAQVLLTKDVVDEEVRLRNVTNTFSRLLELGVIPIVNENDTVAVDELEGEFFGDNDNLSAVVAKIIHADVLVLVSDIDGLYTGDPREDKNATLISVVEEITEDIFISATGTGSNRGTGGMFTKIQAAKTATQAGVHMSIVSGDNPNILYDLFDGISVGTHFVAKK